MIIWWSCTVHQIDISLSLDLHPNRCAYDPGFWLRGSHDDILAGTMRVGFFTEFRRLPADDFVPMSLEYIEEPGASWPEWPTEYQSPIGPLWESTSLLHALIGWFLMTEIIA